VEEERNEGTPSWCLRIGIKEGEGGNSLICMEQEERRCWLLSLWSNSRWKRWCERRRGAAHLLCARGRGREEYIAEFAAWVLAIEEK